MHQFRKIFKYSFGLARQLICFRFLDVLKYLAARLGHGSAWTVKRLNHLNFSMLIDLQDRHAARPLMFLEEYEGHLTRAFQRILKPDSHVLDLGANIGYFT